MCSRCVRDVFEMSPKENFSVGKGWLFGGKDVSLLPKIEVDESYFW